MNKKTIVSVLALLVMIVIGWVFVSISRTRTSSQNSTSNVSLPVLPIEKQTLVAGLEAVSTDWQAGQTHVVNIILSPMVTRAQVIDLAINYDPQILSILSVIPGDYWQTYQVIESEDDGQGTFDYSAFEEPDSLPGTGSKLISIEFVVNSTPGMIATEIMINEDSNVTVASVEQLMYLQADPLSVTITN